MLEVEAKAHQIVRQEQRIDELETEVNVYSENHRMMSEQLREAEMKKHELEQQVRKIILHDRWIMLSVCLQTKQYTSLDVVLIVCMI